LHRSEDHRKRRERSALAEEVVREVDWADGIVLVAVEDDQVVLTAVSGSQVSSTALSGQEARTTGLALIEASQPLWANVHPAA
jgi:hypothetical protein